MKADAREEACGVIGVGAVRQLEARGLRVVSASDAERRDAWYAERKRWMLAAEAAHAADEGVVGTVARALRVDSANAHAALEAARDVGDRHG